MNMISRVSLKKIKNNTKSYKVDLLAEAGELGDK